MSEPTAPQINYIRALQRKLHLPDRLLDQHCVREYGCLFREMNRRDVSALIDQMVSWEALPADLQRANGQRDLPGLEAAS